VGNGDGAGDGGLLGTAVGAEGIGAGVTGLVGAGDGAGVTGHVPHATGHSSLTKAP